MANFSEMSGIKQWAAVVGVAVLLSGALYFTLFKSQREANAAAQAALDAKLRENAELESYRPKLVDIERQLASLKQQLEIERKIVPDEKEVPGFMKMMNAEAMKAGIELRRYTSKPTAAKEYYTEVPFEMELDGPYYSMVNFFDRVGKLERIVNVSGLMVATTKKPTDAKAKHTYQYAPNESVVATCTATTFYSHDLAPRRARRETGSARAGEKAGDHMKLTTGIVFLGMVAGTAWGQNPAVINNTRDTMKAVQQKQAADSNVALASTQGGASNPAAPASTPHRNRQQGRAKRIRPTGCAKSKPVAAHKKSQPKQQIAVENQKKPAEAKTEAPKQINLSGRRDPFVSPVVNRSMMGSGCSTGKRCLAIDQINLKGVVKADSGMIAVVVNSLNKAYFLRENDPVFNGFVVKITGDSIIFKETIQDRLGKPMTREVTKKITTSAV